MDSAVKGEVDLALPPRPRCLFFVKVFFFLFAPVGILSRGVCNVLMYSMRRASSIGGVSACSPLPYCLPTLCLEEPPAASSVP